MKTLPALLILIGSFNYLMSQDIIFESNGNEITAKVTEVWQLCLAVLTRKAEKVSRRLRSAALEATKTKRNQRIPKME